MRDRTRSRRHSPANEAFRQEHQRHRDWGLARRHAEKLRRMQGGATAPQQRTAGTNHEGRTPAPSPAPIPRMPSAPSAPSAPRTPRTPRTPSARRTSQPGPEQPPANRPRPTGCTPAPRRGRQTVRPAPGSEHPTGTTGEAPTPRAGRAPTKPTGNAHPGRGPAPPHRTPRGAPHTGLVRFTENQGIPAKHATVSPSGPHPASTHRHQRPAVQPNSRWTTMRRDDHRSAQRPASATQCWRARRSAEAWHSGARNRPSNTSLRRLRAAKGIHSSGSPPANPHVDARTTFRCRRQKQARASHYRNNSNHDRQ